MTLKTKIPTGHRVPAKILYNFLYDKLFSFSFLLFTCRLPREHEIQLLYLTHSTTRWCVFPCTPAVCTLPWLGQSRLLLYGVQKMLYFFVFYLTLYLFKQKKISTCFFVGFFLGGSKLQNLVYLSPGIQACLRRKKIVWWLSHES